MFFRKFCTGLMLAAMPISGLAAQQATPAQAEARTDGPLDMRAADVVAWLRGQKQPEEIFSPQFLAAIPAETLVQMNTQLATQFGALVGVEAVERVGPLQAKIVLRFEKALGSGTMTLADTPDALIGGLQLSEFTPIDNSAAAISADLDALPGETAVWFGPLDGDAVYMHGNPSQQFALGSAFKLYVLGALGEAVGQGRIAWNQIVPLGARSFPSGITQSWPEKAPVTVHTLATLMISISDNTATDTLIRLVGREAVEDFMLRTGHSDPDRSLPFLTTRELFVLKTLDTGPSYAAATVAARRAMLTDIGSATVTNEQVMTALSKPVMIDKLEWFASMEDERKLLRTLADAKDARILEILAVTPSLPAKELAKWSYVGFKGGSEPGVLNYTWLMRDKAGRAHMLAMSRLDTQADVDSAALGAIAMRILALEE